MKFREGGEESKQKLRKKIEKEIIFKTEKLRK